MKKRLAMLMLMGITVMCLSGCQGTPESTESTEEVMSSAVVIEKLEGNGTAAVEPESEEVTETTEETEEVVETTEEVAETTEEPETVETDVEEAKEVKTGAYDEKEFFDYVNAKRTEAGLGTFEWSDEVAVLSLKPVICRYWFLW